MPSQADGAEVDLRNLPERAETPDVAAAGG
jgi:hypothetical protein